MAKLRWIIPCLVATVDRFTNAVSMTHVLEQIAVPADLEVPKDKKPVPVQPAFAAVTHWVRSQADKEEATTGRVAILGPDKRVLGKTEFALDLTNFRRLRNITSFPGFPYVGKGTYTLRVSVRVGSSWVKAGSTTIEVSIQQPARKTELAKKKLDS